MGVIACQTCYATTTQSASKSSKLCYQCVKGSQLVFEGLKRTVEKALIIIVGPTAVYMLTHGRACSVGRLLAFNCLGAGPMLKSIKRLAVKLLALQALRNVKRYTRCSTRSEPAADPNLED